MLIKGSKKLQSAEWARDRPGCVCPGAAEGLAFLQKEGFVESPESQTGNPMSIKIE